MLPDTVNSWQYHRNNFQKSSQDDFHNYHLWYLWNTVWHFSVSKNVCLHKLSFKFLFSYPITLLRLSSRVTSSFWFSLRVSLRVVTGGGTRGLDWVATDHLKHAKHSLVHWRVFFDLKNKFQYLPSRHVHSESAVNNVVCRTFSLLLWS